MIQKASIQPNPRSNRKRGHVGMYKDRSEVCVSDRNTEAVADYASNLLISLTEAFISTNLLMRMIQREG